MGRSLRLGSATPLIRIIHRLGCPVIRQYGPGAQPRSPERGHRSRGNGGGCHGEPDVGRRRFHLPKAWPLGKGLGLWIQDPCARFPVSGLPARSSVLGLRPSALIGSRVPGARYPGPGTRYQAPVFEKAAHGVCKIGPRGGQGPILYPVPDCLTDSVAHRVCYIGLRLSKFVGVGSRMPGGISPATQRKVTE
jgi:hypothetical protein